MVSVVIPTYNEEKALPDTLRSLFSQAGDFEVIVVDGGSTDHTRAIVSGVAPGPQPASPTQRGEHSALFVSSLPPKAALLK
jgi:GT2 family glycosyltransferase